MNALYRGRWNTSPTLSHVNTAGGGCLRPPAMEEYLQESYGITVYQEQVMLLSQNWPDSPRTRIRCGRRWARSRRTYSTR